MARFFHTLDELAGALEAVRVGHARIDRALEGRPIFLGGVQVSYFWATTEIRGRARVLRASSSLPPQPSASVYLYIYRYMYLCYVSLSLSVFLVLFYRTDQRAIISLRLLSLYVWLLALTACAV